MSINKFYVLRKSWSMDFKALNGKRVGLVTEYFIASALLNRSTDFWGTNIRRNSVRYSKRIHKIQKVHYSNLSMHGDCTYEDRGAVELEAYADKDCVVDSSAIYTSSFFYDGYRANSTQWTNWYNSIQKRRIKVLSTWDERAQIKIRVLNWNMFLYETIFLQILFLQPFFC